MENQVVKANKVQAVGYLKVGEVNYHLLTKSYKTETRGALTGNVYTVAKTPHDVNKRNYGKWKDEIYSLVVVDQVFVAGTVLISNELHSVYVEYNPKSSNQPKVSREQAIMESAYENYLLVCQALDNIPEFPPLHDAFDDTDHLEWLDEERTKNELRL